MQLMIAPVGIDVPVPNRNTRHRYIRGNIAQRNREPNMTGRVVFGLMAALAVSLSASHGVAQIDYGYRTKPITVVALAPDGSWGVATEPYANNAIADAIASCKIKYRKEIGCGYMQVAVFAGWSLAIRCGRENILVAAQMLEAAEQAAINREYELRQDYVPNMPACVRVLTVDPNGIVVAPDARHLLRVVEDRSSQP